MQKDGFVMASTLSSIDNAVASAEALFAALRETSSAASTQRVSAMHTEFERCWSEVATAAAELDAEESQIAQLRRERRELREASAASNSRGPAIDRATSRRSTFSPVPPVPRAPQALAAQNVLLKQQIEALRQMLCDASM